MKKALSKKPSSNVQQTQPGRRQDESFESQLGSLIGFAPDQTNALRMLIQWENLDSADYVRQALLCAMRASFEDLSEIGASDRTSQTWAYEFFGQLNPLMAKMEKATEGRIE